MVRRILAYFSMHKSFVVPKDLPLLSAEENEEVKDEKVPYSWWVRWGTFYYYDKDLKIQTLDLEFESCDIEKYPDMCHDEEDDEEYSDDEKDEEDEEDEEEINKKHS